MALEEREVGAAVITTVLPTAHSSPFTTCRTLFSSPYRNRPAQRRRTHRPPALPSAVPAGARARSVTDMRGLPPPARTHGRAGRAGRGGPRAQVPAAAGWGGPRRARGPSTGLGRGRGRRAGQEAGSRATSERPHVPGDLQPLRPPAPGRRSDTWWPRAASAAARRRAQGPPLL